MKRPGIRLASLLAATNAAAAVFIYLAAGVPESGERLWIWPAWGLLLVSAGSGLALGLRWDEAQATANRDVLTGVYSRRFMTGFLCELLNKVRKRNKKITVALIDLDHFKKVNDTCGHRAGDELLQQVSCILTECSDKGELIARWGGDEFVMVCPYADPETSARLERVIGNKLEALSQRNKVAIAVSMGFAVYPDDGLTMPELLEAADRRMYEQKDKRDREQRVVQHKHNLIG